MRKIARSSFKSLLFMHIPVQKWCGRTKLNWMYLWLDEKRWCMPSLPHCIKQMIKKLFVYSQTCWRSGGKENNPLFSVFQVNPCVQMLLFSSETSGKLMFIISFIHESSFCHEIWISYQYLQPNLNRITDLILKYKRLYTITIFC